MNVKGIDGSGVLDIDGGSFTKVNGDLMGIETTPIPLCTKCGSSRIIFEEIKDCKCKCGANIHFHKTCFDCGFKSIIHRSIFNEFGAQGYVGE